MSIIRGCSYYPPHHDPEDWDRDFRRMAEAGFNAIRTGELLASWDQIEREPRRPDFAWLDRAFALGERYDVRVLLGTGSCCPPIWMLDEYPDLQIRSRDGVAYPTGATWHWACINHPALRSESDRYLGQILERYLEHPALLGWQIDNEPGHPFLPPAGSSTPDWYCYCDHCAARFRAWVRAKYGELARLNDAWRWDPTHHQYADWSRIRPPRATPLEWGVVTAWLDWRAFWAAGWTDFIAHQAGVIKARDARHPVVTNLLDAGDFSNRMGPDPWAIARSVDAIGYDLYPGLRRHAVPERNRPAGGPAYVSWFLDLGRSTALRAGKPLWITEMESGPLDWWIKGPRYTTTPRDIRRWYLEALGHGAKAILYQGYREWNCIPIHWGALVDLHGEPTARYHEAHRMNDLVRGAETVLASAQPVRADVGVLVGHDNVIATAAMGADDVNRRALAGLYEAIWAAHHPVEMLGVDDLDAIPYRVLFLPFAMMVSAATADRLRRYVEEGGTLVAFAKAAMLDERGWYWNARPGGGLDAVFGVREREIAHRAEPFALTAVLAGRRLRVAGFHHQQHLDIAPGAHVLGRFDDGTPAVTTHRFGAGRGVYVATHLDAAAFASADHHAFFAALLRELDVEPPVLVTGPGATGIDAHLLTVPSGEHVLIVTSERTDSATVTLTLPGVWAGSIRHLLDHALEVRSLDPVTCTLRLEAGDATAIIVQ